MSGLRDFLRNETGAVTIEFVTLVPMFVIMLMFFTDASILYLTHSDMFNSARDIARRMSVDQITTVAQAQTHASESLQLGQVAAAVGPQVFQVEVATMRREPLL